MTSYGKAFGKRKFPCCTGSDSSITNGIYLAGGFTCS